MALEWLVDAQTINHPGRLRNNGLRESFSPPRSVIGVLLDVKSKGGKEPIVIFCDGLVFSFEKEKWNIFFLEREFGTRH